MQRKVKRILEQVAKESNIPVSVVQAAVESQFQCAREATKSGISGVPSSFKNIRFPNLGLLVAKEWKIKMLHSRKENKVKATNK